MVDGADALPGFVAQVLAGLVKRALVSPAVEALHAEGAERVLHPPDHRLHRRRPQLSGVELGGACRGGATPRLVALRRLPP